MEYSRINTKTQYQKYCKQYEKIVSDCIAKGLDESKNELAELLYVLIKDYDVRNQSKAAESNPVEFIKALMEENKISAAKLSAETGISKGTISDILHYKKGMGKIFIRKISDYFKVNQEKLNVPYDLRNYKMAS